VLKFKHPPQLDKVKHCNMNVCREEWLLLCAYVTVALHLNAPAASFPGKEPRINWVWHQVVLKSGVGVMAERKLVTYCCLFLE